MRLIDADKLPATCNVVIVNGKLELDGWIAAKRIEEAPTVKAIPIEWIEKYIDNRLVKHGDTWTFINCMIEDWEKENDKGSE